MNITLTVFSGSTIKRALPAGGQLDQRPLDGLIRGFSLLLEEKGQGMRRMAGCQGNRSKRQQQNSWSNKCNSKRPGD